MSFRSVTGLISVIWLLIFVALAQDSGETETSLIYGAQISGEITQQQSRTAYYFDGFRGEVISIRLSVKNGDLDPLLTLLTASGQIISTLDDSGIGRSITINAFTIPESNRYYVIVGRFGMGLGNTIGSFELEIERIGVSGESGSALRYGDSVINTIGNMSPQVYYSFRATKGDIVNISMQRNSGNLDPYLQVVSDESLVIADNDDAISSDSLDASIQSLVIEDDGTYVIVATRYGEAAGTSSGRFILTLEEAENSGQGNAPETAFILEFNESVEGEISNQNSVNYYAFEARKDDIVNIKMTRTSNSLDAFLVLTDDNLQELTSDDDGGGGQNAQINSFRIPDAGKYYVLATRLDRDNGTTAGGYRLELQGLGNAFDGVPEGMQRISYGTTITGRIDETVPEVLFAFFGQEGDAVSVSLNRGDGDLDPAVEILDRDRNVRAGDDDSGGGQNARIARYVLPTSGLYYVRATRFSGTDGNPNTQGSFILVLARIVR